MILSCGILWVFDHPGWWLVRGFHPWYIGDDHHDLGIPFLTNQPVCFMMRFVCVCKNGDYPCNPVVSRGFSSYRIMFPMNNLSFWNISQVCSNPNRKGMSSRKNTVAVAHEKGNGIGHRLEIAKIEEFSCSICGLGVFMLLSGALFLMVLTASQTPSSLKVVSWSSLCRWSLAWCPTVRWCGCGWFAVTATGLTTIWAPDWGKGNIIETSKKTVTCSSQKWRSRSNYWKTPSFYHTTAIFILFDSHEALWEVWALWRISLERRPGSRG